MSFKKGQRVVLIISGAGVETGSIKVIEKVTKKNIKLEDSSLLYSLTGREIDPVIPGFYSRIIELEE